MAANTYYGKYRAKVVEVNDPEKRGRIRVMCPKVLGESKSAWCEPCIPVAYDSGGDFAIPKINEFVWVEFEEGNPKKPVYTGGLWSTNKSPSSSYAVDSRFITWGKCKIVMSEDTTVICVGDSVITMIGNSIHINSTSIVVNGKTLSDISDSE